MRPYKAYAFSDKDARCTPVMSASDCEKVYKIAPSGGFLVAFKCAILYVDFCTSFHFLIFAKDFPL